jgi:hypothetical protein
MSICPFSLTLVDFHVIARSRALSIAKEQREQTKQSKELTEEGLQEIASLCSQWRKERDANLPESR